MKLGTYNFEIVEDYTYIGKILTNTNEIRPEIEKIITNANIAHYALAAVLYSRANQYSERKK